MPRVSVVVPARNEEEYIGACLDAILAQKPPPDEVIVVNNGSKDRTAEIAQAKGVRVIHEPRPGLHLARQAGLKAARYEVVANTDADCIVLPGWIEAIKEAFEDPKVVETYGPLELFEAPWLDKILAKHFYPVFLWIMARLGQPNAAGGNHAVRRETALAVGGYDVRYGEDLHLMMKLRKHGEIRYVPKQRVMTSGRRLKHGRWKLYAVHAKNIWRRIRGLPEDYGDDYYADRER